MSSAMNEIDRYELVCRERFDRLERKLDAIDRLLRGDGAAGLVTRVDRIEEANRQRRRWMWALVAVCGSTIGALVRGLIR